MADRFTTRTTTSYGKRILISIQGVFSGFVFFIVSFCFLYWNEGKVNLSTIAKTAVEINSQQPASPALNGKLASTTGVVDSKQLLGDNLFLNQDRYLAIEQKVEMRAWVENKETRSQLILVARK